MTTAGLNGLLVASRKSREAREGEGIDKQDTDRERPTAKRALAWLGKNFQTAQNPPLRNARPKAAVTGLSRAYVKQAGLPASRRGSLCAVRRGVF